MKLLSGKSYSEVFVGTTVHIPNPEVYRERGDARSVNCSKGKKKLGKNFSD